MTEQQNPPSSAGSILRAARERQGLHIAALAAAIKVSPRKLDALENDRWHELPDATFVRALAQTVCRTLKIDARPVLEKLPAPTPVALERHDSGLNEPFRDRPGREEPGLAASAVKPMVWAAAVLMVAAALVYFLPASLFSSLPKPGVALSPASPVTVPVPVPVPAPLPAAASAAASGAEPAMSAASASAAAAPGPAASAGALASASSGETVFSAPVAALAAAASGAEAPAATRLLQLRTSEASWIEVRDAKGTLLLSRTVLPSESVGLDGQLPLRLTIGNASATQLLFRGQSVDLSGRTRDNVARVDLP
jgi:cytoskeleton protein RodZ